MHHVSSSSGNLYLCSRDHWGVTLIYNAIKSGIVKGKVRHFGRHTFSLTAKMKITLISIHLIHSQFSILGGLGTGLFLGLGAVNSQSLKWILLFYGPQKWSELKWFVHTYTYHLSHHHQYHQSHHITHPPALVSESSVDKYEELV